MNEFTSINDVSFQNILDVLQRWEVGILRFGEVEAWAEGVIVNGWHEYDRDDPRSLLAYVIHLLDDIYVNPVLVQDIPTLSDILHQALISPADAWDSMSSFEEAIDWDYRQDQARENIRKHQSPRLDEISDV